jgi:predicted NAD-dependent protein-ADP-ribosyltransferase YbiA (DUF1768 family)
MPVTTTPHPSTPITTAAASTARPVYFWRPFEGGTGFLGQWYHAPFTVDGATYTTCEMYMMVQKARLFGDEKVAKDMIRTKDPKAHKALGRKVKNFNDATWDKSRLLRVWGWRCVKSANVWIDKFDIVVQGNMHKFTLCEDAENMRKWLLATGDRELVEASPMDRIWGVGFAAKDAGANRHRWGQNLLGKALMVVRTRLREEEAKEKKIEGAGVQV